MVKPRKILIKNKRKKEEEKGSKRSKRSKGARPKKVTNLVIIPNVSDKDILALMKQSKKFPGMEIVKNCTEDDAMNFLGIMDYEFPGKVALADETKSCKQVVIPVGYTIIHCGKKDKWYFLD